MPVHKRLTLAVVAMALAAAWVSAQYGSRSAGGADSYGYISQADAWISGELVQHQPFTDLADGRPPVDRWVVAPLGWKPAPGSWNVVPTYAAGYPLMLAAAKRVAGHRALFLVVPLTAGLLVWSTFLLGARLGRPGEGTLAALLVATSATVLYMSMAPMSDVPSAALWTLTLALVLSWSRASALGAGAVCALAILVRPNLAPLALIMAAWLVVNDLRRQTRWSLGAVAGGRALPFGLIAATGAKPTPVINKIR
jgi:asparagine N-glycosylation enzyme membrane subunit Stt3